MINVFISLSCRQDIFYLLVIGVAGTIPLWGVSTLDSWSQIVQKSLLSKPWVQAVKQHCSMLSILAIPPFLSLRHNRLLLRDVQAFLSMLLMDLVFNIIAQS